MKRWLTGSRCLLTSGAAVVAGPAAAHQRTPASMRLTRTSGVAPDGSVRSDAIDHADKVQWLETAQLTRRDSACRSRSMPFAGNRAAAQAEVSLHVVARPIVNDNYKSADALPGGDIDVFDLVGLPWKSASSRA